MAEPELTEVLKGRAFLYDFLARTLLGPPSAELLRECRELQERLGELCRGMGDAGASAGHARMQEALAALPADEAAALLELNRQYTATYSVGGEAVSLYESVYRSVEGLMKQEPWEEVCAFYAKSGLGLSGGTREMEDHAGVELAFMSRLVHRALESQPAPAAEGPPAGGPFEQAMEVQRMFMEEHLALWLPQAMKLVVERAPGKRALFYGGLAGLTEGFLRIDREFLSAW